MWKYPGKNERNGEDGTIEQSAIVFFSSRESHLRFSAAAASMKERFGPILVLAALYNPKSFFTLPKAVFSSSFAPVFSKSGRKPSTSDFDFLYSSSVREL